MAELSIKVKDNRKDEYTKYKNKTSAEDYRKLALILTDLKNLGLPIEKAIKEFRIKKSDWDAALGL